MYCEKYNLAKTSVRLELKPEFELLAEEFARLAHLYFHHRMFGKEHANQNGMSTRTYDQYGHSSTPSDPFPCLKFPTATPVTPNQLRFQDYQPMFYH